MKKNKYINSLFFLILLMAQFPVMNAQKKETNLYLLKYKTNFTTKNIINLSPDIVVLDLDKTLMDKGFVLIETKNIGVGAIFFSNGFITINYGNTTGASAFYIDELRISKGIARWTCTGCTVGTKYFTPPGNLDFTNSRNTSNGRLNLPTDFTASDYPAINSCYNLNLSGGINGFSNWYLPSSGELDKLSSQLLTNKYSNLTNFSQSNYYWSSTANTSNRVYAKILTSSTAGSYQLPSNNYYVRCLRRFGS